MLGKVNVGSWFLDWCEVELLFGRVYCPMMLN